MIIQIRLRHIGSLLVFLLSSFLLAAQTENTISISENYTANTFSLFTSTATASICIDSNDAKVVTIAASAFANDIQLLSGKQVSLKNEISSDSNIIVAGTIGHSKLIDELIKSNLIDVSVIKNKWESFIIHVVVQNNVKRLIIAGSDRRGTAFGVFHLSRLMGVHPFVWWADVIPAKKDQLYISGSYISKEPSVKYRGIFINDEDWGLQPWAAQHMDTDIKDIGPKTYAKVFELMLRLKANYIWPAMHPCTKAFYYYKENPQVADDYAIVVGSSHAEPMLRNNVFEWAVNFENEYGKKHGEWRYDSNRNEIHTYWNDRVKQAKGRESIFTVGMRGVHDSGMPGPKDPDEKVKLLEQIIADQRQMFQNNFKKSPNEIPQIFVPYKEVLSLYRRGMKLPNDITIIWPDDNHGYIRQLPNEAERKRNGGHGVYYHLSYWGAPQDYLWLSSISPSLISYEMTKAYNYGADRLWVFNVGDIKPAELELQFAMDLAWDVNKWSPGKAKDYTYEWAKEIFGDALAEMIAKLKNWYYQLAASGKPEHMNQVEFGYSQAKERISQYSLLSLYAIDLKKKIPAHLQDAYYELIYYPIQAATLMNYKILDARLSFYSDTNNAFHNSIYCNESRRSFREIQKITDEYNHITSGKWNGIMSWHPRDRPVFEMPVVADSASQPVKDSLVKKYFTVVEPVLAYLAASSIKKTNSPEAALQVTSELGISPNAITTTQTKSLITKDAAYIEFDLSVSPELTPGNYDIVVKCLPTFDVTNFKQLRYSIAIDDETPQTVNVHAETDSEEWKKNVIRGFSLEKSTHAITGTSKLRIWFNDPGLVINTIEFYKQ